MYVWIVRVILAGAFIGWTEYWKTVPDVTKQEQIAFCEAYGGYSAQCDWYYQGKQ